MSVLELLESNPWIHGVWLGGLVAAVVMILVAWGTWWERKFAGRMQSRFGPTVVGPQGLLQPIADAIKLMLKEDLIPAAADRKLYTLAPLLALFLSLSCAAVIPLAAGVQVANLNIGVLFLLGLGSMMVVPVWLAGWASANKYAVIGGMRAVAQAVSYEVPMVLAALVPVVLAGSMNLQDIVAAQAGYHWFILWPTGPGLVAFVVFLLASLAEANRIPFDIPEAESELVAGVTTEYTGMKFGLFYLAEYVHIVVGSAVAATLFLGGWEGPGSAYWPIAVLWITAKTCVLFTVILWIRWTYLRLRSDQLMSFCWKTLIPASLVVLMAAALWVHFFPGVTA
jgi:NADH-quinone oxidoreductase subunit H